MDGKLKEIVRIRGNFVHCWEFWARFVITKNMGFVSVNKGLPYERLRLRGIRFRCV